MRTAPPTETGRSTGVLGRSPFHLANWLSLCTALLLGPLSALAATDPHSEFNSVTPTNFDSGGAVSLQFHLHAESYLHTTTIARGEEHRELEQTSAAGLEALPVLVDGDELTFADYVAGDELLDSVIVLHGGKVAVEAYPKMAPEERHFGWSVTKVLTSAALATLVAEGKVEMEDSIERYLPELESTAWAGTSIYDIANMASGMDCRDSDGYQDNSTCVYRMEEALGITAPTGRDESFTALVKGMGRLRPAGERNEYVSANTNVLMLVIERVTGQSYADAVEERIWSRIGAESDALMAVSDEGYAYASGGLMARLRDLARFGLVFTDSEDFPDIANTMMADLKAGGGIARSKEQLEWLKRDHGDDLPRRAGWQWDQVWDDGGAFKGGYLGQGLYVDPARDLVIAWYGTGLDFSAQQTDMLSVARQVAVSGVFASRADPESLKALTKLSGHHHQHSGPALAGE